MHLGPVDFLVRIRILAPFHEHDSLAAFHWSVIRFHALDVSEYRQQYAMDISERPQQ